jgi:hypothetical protein
MVCSCEHGYEHNVPNEVGKFLTIFATADSKVLLLDNFLSQMWGATGSDVGGVVTTCW